MLDEMVERQDRERFSRSYTPRSCEQVHMNGRWITSWRPGRPGLLMVIITVSAESSFDAVVAVPAGCYVTRLLAS